MSTSRTTWWMAGCAVAVALGGCRSASTRIYTLGAAAPASQIEIHHAPALRVDTLNVPANWDRLEILTLSAAGTLQISEFDHWAAPLAQMARQELSEDLDQRLPSGSVIYPRLPKPSGALGVNVDILEFDIIASQASMRASWSIVPSGKARGTEARGTEARGAEAQGGAKRSTAELRSPMSSEDPAAVAHAWSDLLGQLADRIAADDASFDMP